MALLRRDLEQEFRKHLGTRSYDDSSLSPQIAIDAVVDFYRIARFQGCELDDDGDMLLFQWSICDLGDTEFFDIEFTRQLIDCRSDGRLITQVAFGLRHPVTAESRGIESGNIWCEHVDFANKFLDDVLETKAFQIACRMKERKIEISTPMSR